MAGKPGRSGRSNLRCPYDRSVLRIAYVTNGASLKEVADDLGHASVTIRRWLIEAGIPLRSQGGANNPWGNPGKREVA